MQYLWVEQSSCSEADWESHIVDGPLWEIFSEGGRAVHRFLSLECCQVAQEPAQLDGKGSVGAEKAQCCLPIAGQVDTQKTMEEYE